METLTFRSPRLVALALLVILAAGISAFLSLGRQEDPTITNINAVVTTIYPGADPARVESLVTRPLEEEIRRISEVNNIESTSADGISVVSLELEETVDPGRIEQVWAEVRDAVDDASRSFPAGVLAPDFDSDRFGAAAAIIAIRPSGEAFRPAIAARYADELAERLRNVPGTKLVSVVGRPDEEVLVRLDPMRTAALGLTPDGIAAAISASDAKVRSGRMTGTGADLLLDVTGDIEMLDRVREVVVAGDGQGTTVRLGDLAEISRGPREPADAHALSDGREAILLSVMVSDGLRIDQWMSWMQDELSDFTKTLPASIEAVQIFDQSEYTGERLRDVALNMAIGVALVVAVLFVTLGLRAALVVALVLPLVSLATIASMNFIGLPLHQMSVTGLIVALGLLVDAAIVMADEVRQRLGRGLPRVEAVGGAVRRLTVPLLASTVTTALSFVPMMLLPGPAGDFVGSIAISVVLMLVWSFVIAVVITPALAGWLLPGGGASPGISGGVPARAFRAVMIWSVRNPLKSVALALVLPVTGFASFPTLTAQFFPGVDRDQFHIEVELAPGTGIDRTLDVVRRMDAELRGTEGIERVTWAVGRSAPAFYYNIVGNRENEPSFAQALITTESPDATAELLTPLQHRLSDAFPEARVLVRGLVQGPPVNAPVEFRLVGQDLETLRRLGDRAREVLLTLDAVTIVRTDLEGGAPKVTVDVDEPAARLAGLDLGTVARQLETALVGATGGSLIEAGEELPVRVRYGDDVRGDVSRIATLRILPADAPAQAAGGALPGVPLSAIADVRLEPSESAITRRNGERVNTVQAFLKPGILPEEALADARAALDAAGFVVPAGYRVEVGGDSDARSQVVGNLLASLGLIVTLSIATVVLTFNSFRLSAVTFVVAVLSAGLSILALAVFGYPFGITAVIGVIGSIGVSINAAIIILTGLQQDPGAAAGDPEAMAEVVVGSSRHITSTTLTTAGGFLPLMLDGGGFWPPFAMAIAGGVLLSTVVSFFFVPQVYALVRARRGPEEDAGSEVLPEFPRLAAE